MILNEEGGIEWVAEDEYEDNKSDPDGENYYTHDYGDEPPSSEEVSIHSVLDQFPSILSLKKYPS